MTSPASRSAASRLSTIRADGTAARLVNRFRGLTIALPDRTGSRLAVVSSQGLSLAVGRHPPQLLVAAAQLDAWTAPAWNPQYTKLAYRRSDGIWVRDLAARAQNRMLKSDARFNYSLDW